MVSSSSKLLSSAKAVSRADESSLDDDTSVKVAMVSPLLDEVRSAGEGGLLLSLSIIIISIKSSSVMDESWVFMRLGEESEISIFFSSFFTSF